jgi:hypothetical protein
MGRWFQARKRGGLMTAILTVREYVALWLFVVLGSAITILFLLDWAVEQYDDYRQRERIWQSIEVRSSRERHPSNRVSVFDQDKGGN